MMTPGKYFYIMTMDFPFDTWGGHKTVGCRGLVTVNEGRTRESVVNELVEALREIANAHTPPPINDGIILFLSLELN